MFVWVDVFVRAGESQTDRLILLDAFSHAYTSPLTCLCTSPACNVFSSACEHERKYAWRCHACGVTGTK